MNHVFVVDAQHRPLSMCHPARARALLREKRAAVLRRYPFTIILKDAMPDAVAKPLKVKIDPGSRTTGFALVDAEGRVLFAAELTHRGGAIKASLDARRALRRGRRHRKTRYRAARFDNRAKPVGWLPPSLQHRVNTTMTWVGRFQRFAPVEEVSVERVKFDMQAMQNPEIAGVEYQQGELAGYEVREYLLAKFGHTCAYCDAQNVPFNLDHVHPKAKGGSNRVSNLALTCVPCNTRKDARAIEDFLAHDPARLASIKAQLKRPLKDAAAVNATREALFRALLQTGLPVEAGTGAQTKFNRCRLSYPKAHWVDAACVGDSGASVTLDPAMKPLLIKATGHGYRQRCRSDGFGFPRPAAPNVKKFAGFQTGDLVTANIPKGKFAGHHTGRIAIRHRPSFRLNGFDVHPKYLTRIQQADGYAYA